MHFPKFWTLAKKGGVAAWGWSDVSLAEAQKEGLSRVDRIIEWLRTGMEGDRGAYGYPDRRMREEVLRDFVDTKGSRCAVVSRNSYGCLVLNTTNLLFIDIDERSTGLFAAVASLFRGGGFDGNVVANVKKWLSTRPDWGLRVYRTRAGIRLLATHNVIGPEDTVSAEAFKFFGADWLYRKLCVNQKCFRARLTPKPWRCGIEKPKTRWPWMNAESKAQFEQWSEQYRSAIQKHAVCRLIGHFGQQEIHPELRELVAFHDSATGIQSNLNLA